MEPQTRRGFLRGIGATAALGATAYTGLALNDADIEAPSSIIPFRGRHQAGVTSLPGPAGVVAAFDVRVPDRAGLIDLVAEISGIIEKGMAATAYETRQGGFPPVDTGILGPDPEPSGTAVVLGFGHSLFDDRFGLASRIPLELQPMPKFNNDYLVRPERSHGDIAITIRADSSEAATHMLRQVRRRTRGQLIPRWMKEGFNKVDANAGPHRAPGRNLLGFKDGTSNVRASDPDDLNSQVWVRPGEGQPEWAVGGTYQAIRVIRMMVEFWDRTRLSEQESIFGRHRDSGAPLGMQHEVDEPVFSGDLDSHIARANPRTPGSEANRILRRGFNYTSGLDDNDQLDQGLIFISYQRSLEAGFLAVQNRLDGEALEEYIRPLGGGFFFVPPAPEPGDGMIAERLFT